MDPSMTISSPFHDAVRGNNGILDSALQSITTSSPSPIHSPSNVFTAAAAETPKGQTFCTVCGTEATTARVPEEGIYTCSSCVAVGNQSGRPPRSYPTMTFKCCPAQTSELQGGVVRCAGCKGWYHNQCVSISDPRLQEYVGLSTTKWYCMEPTCAETVLLKHVKS